MNLRRPLFCLLPLLCLCAGCELVAEKDAFSWRTVQELFRQELGKIVAQAVLGNFLGALAGFAVGLLAWQAYRGLARCWGTERRDPLDSRVLGMVLLFVGTVLGGWIGMLEGGKRGVRAALRNGPIGQEVLPQVGNTGADLLVRVDQFLQTGMNSADDVVNRFQAGTWKLDVLRLRHKISQLESASSKQLADFALEKVYEENPDFKGGLQETILSWVVPRLADALSQENLPGLREEFDTEPFLARLVEVAQQHGADGMTRKQLSQFFVDQVVVPDVFANLERQTRRIQRFLAYGLGGMVGGALLLGLLVRPFRRSQPFKAATNSPINSGSPEISPSAKRK